MTSTAAMKINHEQYNDESRRRRSKLNYQCPPPALMHAVRRQCHSQIAAAMMKWSSLAHFILNLCLHSSRSMMLIHLLSQYSPHAVINWIQIWWTEATV